MTWEVELSAATWPSVLRLTTSNISRGGLFILTKQIPKVNEALKLTLKLPDGSSLDLEGKVAHVIAPNEGKTTGFGVRFDEKHAVDLNLLEAIAASHAGGRHVYCLEPHHMVLPALVRDLLSTEEKSAEVWIDTPPEEKATSTSSPTPPQTGPAWPRVSTAPTPPPIPPLPPQTGPAWPRVSTAPTPPPIPPLPPQTGPAWPRVSAQASPDGVREKPDDFSLENLDSSEFGERTLIGTHAASIASLPPFANEGHDSSPRITPNSAPHPPSAAPPQDTKELIFGIDFGTTSSTIGVVDGDGVHILEDASSSIMLPSVVCLPPGGEPIVGDFAREMGLLRCEHTLFSPKRLLGRKWNDPLIQRLIETSTIPLQPDQQGNVAALVHGELVTIIEICAKIFEKLKEIGETATGYPVRRVVLSAPVAYDPIQRAAIQEAAELVGLEVMAMIEEPLAAAIAYGLGHADGKLIAVYDFGGGTFDCTLLRIEENHFTKICSAGDAWLGGDDLDGAMANHAAETFEKNHGIDLRQRRAEWLRLSLLCERAKRRLSTNPDAELRVRGLIQTAEGPLDLSVHFNRDLFASICGDLIDQSIATMDRALSSQDIAPSEIDHVIVIGGVSRTPLVRERLQHYFGREISLAVEPEQAIAIGNAIYGRFLLLTGGNQMPF